MFITEFDLKLVLNGIPGNITVASNVPDPYDVIDIAMKVKGLNVTQTSNTAILSSAIQTDTANFSITLFVGQGNITVLTSTG